MIESGAPRIIGAKPGDWLLHRSRNPDDPADQAPPPAIILMRDPHHAAWIIAHVWTGQLLRVWDNVDDHFYRNIGPYFQDSPLHRNLHPGDWGAPSFTKIGKLLERLHW